MYPLVTRRLRVRSKDEDEGDNLAAHWMWKKRPVLCIPRRVDNKSSQELEPTLLETVSLGQGKTQAKSEPLGTCT